MNFKQTARDIKALKIQGAQRIALAASLSLKSCKTYSEFLIAKKLLEKARPTEPNLRNALFYVDSLIDKSNFSKSLDLAVNKVEKYFIDGNDKIMKYGANKLAGDRIVFTHCHSSTVTGVIIRGSKRRKLIVHNTETRPFFQGRMTATELAKNGIKVTHFVDSAARFALKKADIVLLGCDSITSDGFIINKIGSEMICEIADNYDIPIYICTLSWKFNGRTSFGFEQATEERYKKEVWDKPPRNVSISNIVFEKIHKKLITGIISELGVLTVDNFIEEVKNTYPCIV